MRFRKCFIKRLSQARSDCKQRHRSRKQRVVIPGACSEWLAITAGVPQGSIRGPLLFFVYINDIVEDIHSHIRLFADDTSLYLIVNEPYVDAMQLNSDLTKIHL